MTRKRRKKVRKSRAKKMCFILVTFLCLITFKSLFLFLFLNGFRHISPNSCRNFLISLLFFSPYSYSCWLFLCSFFVPMFFINLFSADGNVSIFVQLLLILVKFPVRTLFRLSVFSLFSNIGYFHYLVAFQCFLTTLISSKK